MRTRLYRRLLAAGFVFSLFLVLLPPMTVLLTFPDEVRLFRGEKLDLDVGPLFTLSAVPPAGAEGGTADVSGVDEYLVELRLFGWLPVDAARVHVVPERYVVPGGQAIGILLSSEGIIVVQTAPVTTRSGENVSPAAEAGIRPGDILVRVGNTPIDHPVELEPLVDTYGRSGRAMPVWVRRDGREMLFRVRPALARDPRGGGFRYMLGLYLKDPAAGVGTLTFWDPVDRVYGALGHKVAAAGEPDTLAFTEGRIVSAQIHGIHPGTPGRPGEKLGIFESGTPLGTIEKNTPFGIFGRLERLPRAERDPVPVALAHEVREGPAEILTVVEGGRVDAFGVRIVAVQRQAKPSGKGLVVEVTDPRLLQRTRGIVQGMSGSPILQGGKLVGAVTHVFINNPERGYGVLAEWMVYEAGLGRLDEPAWNGVSSNRLIAA